jgi:hypothetical protein
MRRPQIVMLLMAMSFASCAWSRPAGPTPGEQFRGWKTYRNRKFGFELRLPRNFSVVENGPDSYEQQLLAGEQISGTQPPLLDSVDVKDAKGRKVLTVEIPDQKNFQVVQGDYDWSLRACGEVGFLEIKSKVKTLFAGYKTLKVASDHMRYYCINFPHNPVIIYFNSKSRAIASKILSTFSFPK